MKNEHYMFAQSLSSFLTEYMKSQRKQSQNTIESYRDTFILIFKFFDEKGLKVKKLLLNILIMKILLIFYTGWKKTEIAVIIPSIRGWQLSIHL